MLWVCADASWCCVSTVPAEKGGDPEIVRESQRRRFADVSLVDKVIELDQEWRQGASPSASAVALRRWASFVAIHNTHNYASFIHIMQFASRLISSTRTSMRLTRRSPPCARRVQGLHAACLTKGF